MKLIGLLVFPLLFHEFHGSAEAVGVEQSAEQENINAVLALAKSSLSGNGDKEQVLKNAKILLSEFEGNEQIDSALAELVAGTQKAIKHGDALQQCAASSPEDLFINYADRHARRLEEIVHDFDCMEREFDASDPDFDPDEAANVFTKCRLLVLRNVFSHEMMQAYRKKYEDYILAVHEGKIDKSNTKTTDAKVRDIVQRRGRKRHDIMMPQWLGGEQIAGNAKVLEILRHDKVLGPGMVLNQMGSVIAERGAPAMYWHEDQNYIYTDDSFENSGIGGHDLLPYVANMFVPLLDATIDHGPTEFCVGSSHIAGIPTWPSVMNNTLTEGGSPFNKMQEFADKYDACPPEHWRVPLVGMGDVVIFDYNLIHRGGPNMSQELRSLLYVIYSRGWFRDMNFDNTYSEDEEQTYGFDEWSSGMRYARIDESEVKNTPQASTTLASVEHFAGIREHEQKRGTVEFPFTNINVEGASIFLEGKLLTAIAPKKQWLLTAAIGQELSAHDKDGKVIKTWIIVPDQRQTILCDVVME
eukprot:scaffold156601_cov51-Attheya_sp.AAC.1